MDMPISRMRLLDEAAAELKKMDPDTSITKYFIRKLAIDGKIKSIMAGRKRLINLDSLLEYLSESHENQPKEIHGIRKQA
jgi:excisionase family DNA binding protein